VVCTDVLEHVLDLNLACAKILSVLRPMGMLIVRVPFQEDLSQYVAPTFPYKYVHMRNFDQYSLQLLFERILGCEIVEMATAGYIPYGARLKFPLSFPKRDGILRRLLALIKAVYVPAYEALLRKGFDPVEINVVVKKTQESFSPFV
jgi:hypothetical protein